MAAHADNDYLMMSILKPDVEVSQLEVNEHESS